MDRSRKMTAEAAAAALAELRAAARHAHSTDADAAVRRRDPRVAAPPASEKKTVTISESCRFYGAQDAISTCRVPRSCQDCLQMPGCVITEGGVCQRVQDLQPTWIRATNMSGKTERDEFFNYDFHNFLQPYPMGTAYNITLAAVGGDAYFYATNATYCAASDPVCTQCRSHFKAVASSADTIDQIRTQFCVGDGGCVCVAVCEVPELLAVRANDTECHAHLELPVRRYDRFTRPARWNQRRDPRASVGSGTVEGQREASCAFLDQADIQGNRQPRTCSDCLTRDGCMVSLTGDGVCTSMESYSPSQDFRTRKPQFKPTLYFPSNSTSYCPASDPVCTTCRKKFLAKGANASMTWNDWKTRNESTHCIGEGGCVCIEQCEVNAVNQDLLDCDPAKAGQSVTESCGYYDVRDSKGCKQPRTCGECLQKQECMIVLTDKYECSLNGIFYPWTNDYRLETKVDVYLADAVQFPANSTTICSASDPICAFCRDQFRWHPGTPVDVGLGYTLYIPTSNAAYCVGRDGCVCIDRCEDPKLFMKDAQDTQYKLGDVSDHDPTVPMVIVVAVLIVVIAGVRWFIAEQQRRRNSPVEDAVDPRTRSPAGMRRHMLDEAPALHLDLYGWRRFVEVLVTKEQELLAGAAEISPVAQPVDFDYETLPTAPDFDEEDDPTAPTATNPHALASAPTVSQMASSERDQTEAALAPSAPDFD